MITFPNCKINLGLNIVERRSDGYHNLETVFYPVNALHDALEVTPADDASTGNCYLYQHGTALDCEPEKNLVVKAYRLLQAQYNDLPSINIHLIKHIPSGAGLGGGSADAAFMLKLLNDHFSLKLCKDELEHLATKLGADCPFFIQNHPTFATGIGEVFTPINLSLKGYQIIIVKPNVFISTREAFAHIHPQKPAQCITNILQAPITEWRHHLVNDFEASIFPQHPEIAALKALLYEKGAEYASMSGSGSSVFGIFNPDDNLPQLALSEDCFCFNGRLL